MSTLKIVLIHLPTNSSPSSIFTQISSEAVLPLNILLLKQTTTFQTTSGQLKQESWYQKYFLTDHTQPNKCVTSQVKLEEQKEIPTEDKLKDILVNESPIAPLRYSQVQKSIEVLRRAIPDIVDDILVDKMYLSLFKNFNSVTTQLVSKPKQPVEPKKPSGHKKGREHQKRYNQIKPTKNGKQEKMGPDQILYMEKMRLFKKHQELKAIEKQAKLVKKQQKKSKKEAEKKLLKQIWNDEIQAEFIELYQKSQQFHVIKKQLSLKYPAYKDYFSYNQLRYQAYKIFRLAIRKLYYVITNFKDSKLPDLLKITEIRYNFIFYYKQGAQVRYMLTELYRLQELNRELLCNLIISINNLCIGLEQDKELLSRIGRKGGRRDRSSQAASRYQLGNQGAISKKRNQIQEQSQGQSDSFGYFS